MSNKSYEGKNCTHTHKKTRHVLDKRHAETHLRTHHQKRTEGETPHSKETTYSSEEMHVPQNVREPNASGRLSKKQICVVVGREFRMGECTIWNKNVQRAIILLRVNCVTVFQGET